MIKSKKIKLLGGLRSGRQEEKRKAIAEDYARIRVEIIKKDREMEEYKVVLKKMLSGYKIKMGIFPKDIMQENKVSYYVVDKENKVVKWEIAKPITRCPKCGAGLERKDSYCWECGQKIDWSEE